MDTRHCDDDRGTERGPPRLAERLLGTILPVEERGAVTGDLSEEYARYRLPQRGRKSADRWYWRQVLASLIPTLLRRRWRSRAGFTGPGRRPIRQPEMNIMDSLLKDVRYAVRGLLAQPLFTLLATITLALGVGGTAAIFSIVDDVLLRPLPFADSEELVTLWSHFDWSEAEHVHLEGRWPGFQAVSMFTRAQLTLKAQDGPASMVSGVQATTELFDVLGVAPARGRSFERDDGVEGAEQVVVLSHGLWQQELGGDPDMVGKTVELNGTSWTVVGVMPRTFYFPDPSARFWIPTQPDAANRNGTYTPVGRLAAGQTLATMGPDLDRLTTLLGERFTYPVDWDKTKNAELTPLSEFLRGDMRPSLILLLGAMGLILLIACANVAALILGRMGSRRSELAVRAALGAGRGRLARQVLTESLVLAVLAGGVGAGVAAGAFRILITGLPLGPGMAEVIALDWSIVGASMVLALLAGTLVGAAPVISLFRTDLKASLTNTRGGTGARPGRDRLEGSLVLAEVALAMLMVSGAGLLMKSVSRLQAIDPGIEVQGVLTIDVVGGVEVDDQARIQFMDEAIRRLRALPGVESAAAIHKLPLRGGGSSSGFRLESRPDDRLPSTYFRMVSRGYFRTMGISLLQGRTFDATDEADSPLTVVISKAVADRFFPGEDPLGQRVTTGFGGWATIIGVVENVKVASLTDGPATTRYLAMTQAPFMPQGFTFTVRTPGEPTALISAIRAEIAAADARMAVARVETMEQVFTTAVGDARQVMVLLSLLGALALTLGAVGVYGVINHFVGQRTKEWGIRMALGLEPSGIATRIIRQGGVLIGGGVVLGVAVSVIATRLLSSLLYEVSAVDPLTILTAAATLMGAGLLAAFVPAFRASRVEPVVALRSE